MFFSNNFTKAQFVHRPDRFQAYVIIDGEIVIVHVPNTGRCKEILVSSTKVILREENNPTRKTRYDLIGAYKDDKFINIDSQVPNKVVHEALLNGKIMPLEKYKIIEREKTYGNSRLDFKLTNDDGHEYYLEIKGVTLEQYGVAKFPDAPTIRGRKHLLELIDIKETGRGAGVLFLIQMEGIKYFTPNDDMDKLFSENLREAYKSGVDVFAYDCSVGENFITLKSRVEIIL